MDSSSMYPAHRTEDEDGTLRGPGRHFPPAIVPPSSLLWPCFLA